ncbi:MAG: EamA family transporter [Mycobacteriales bacterium]
MAFPHDSGGSRASRRQIWIALALVYVIWGSTYLGIKVTVETLPAMLSAGFRFCLAGLLLFGILAIVRPGALRARRRELVAPAVAGVFMLGVGNGGVVLAEDLGLGSGLAALLVAAIPLWVALIRFAAGDRPSRFSLLGVAVGFAGVAVLLLPGGDRTVRIGPAVILMVGSFAWSAASYGTTRAPMPASPFLATAIEMVTGGLTCFAVGLVRGEHFSAGAVSGRSWLGLAYLIVFGSLVAFTSYVWALAHASVSTVSTYAYVNPAIAVLLGAVIAHEPVTAGLLAGGALIVAAVAMVVTAEGRRRSRR